MMTLQKLLVTGLASGLLGAALHGQVIFSFGFEGQSQGQTTATIGTDGFTIENGFNNRTDFWAVEGGGSDPAGAGNNGADLFDATNTRGFGLRDLDDTNNPGTPNSITFAPIDMTGFLGSSLEFSFDMTSDVSVYNDNNDTLAVQFDLDYDGVTFDIDETYALAGTTNLGDGTTTSVAGSFTNFAYGLTGAAGGDLGIRIVATGFFDGNDRVTFDNIELSAVPEPSTFALLAGIGALACILYRRRRR